uniref:Protein LTV1 homolog n=1 Tax=Elaeophora elaphi TaxID=1147741 RepID=A0A0R3RLN9_9BILA
MIQYSDHCSSAELRSFLSLLSFSHLLGIPNKLPRLVENELQNLSLSGVETIDYFKEEGGNPEELLFDPFRFSWRIGIAFDYALRKFYDQLSMIENLPDLSRNENMGAMLVEASYVDNFISEEHLEMNIFDSDRLINVPDSWDSNSSTYSFLEFFTNFVNRVLHSGDKDDPEGVEDRLDEMAILDVKYTRNDQQKMEDSSQDTDESTGSSLSDTKVTIKMLEEQYDVSVLLDNLTNTFHTTDTDFHSTEDTEFLEYLSDMDIAKNFNDFDDLFEKYRKSIGEMSVGIMNQLYHAEGNVCYDPSNAPVLPNVVHELLDQSATSELHQDDFTSLQQISAVNHSVLKDLSNSKN